MVGPGVIQSLFASDWFRNETVDLTLLNKT